MRLVPLILLMLSCAFAVDAAAQDTPSTRRPPRDTLRIGTRIPAADSIRMAEVGEPDQVDAFDADDPVDADDSVDAEDSADGADAELDTVPGPYARSGGTGPFTVQSSGQVAPRPARGEVVWVNARPAPRVSADTAQRAASGQAARRDTASATRPPARTAAADTARTGQGVSSTPAARRDTAGSTRPPSRPPARDTAAARRNQTAPAPPSPSSGRAPTHTVASGETFYGIARRYGVTSAQLRALNPDVDVNALEVGDQLRLPAGARDGGAPAQRRAQEPARTGAQTQPGTRSHTVAAGETLFGIARRYGVTVDAIRRANQLETDQVRTGQRLVIPPGS